MFLGLGRAFAKKKRKIYSKNLAHHHSDTDSCATHADDGYKNTHAALPYEEN
jgi:hypothetical protein